MTIALGSTAHRDLLCQEFVGGHVAYDPRRIDWPDLDDQTLRLLRSLPIWTQSVRAERETAVIVRAMATHERDPVMAEAIGLQAFEEERHAALIEGSTASWSGPGSCPTSSAGSGPCFRPVPMPPAAGSRRR